MTAFVLFAVLSVRIVAPDPSVPVSLHRPWQHKFALAAPDERESLFADGHGARREMRDEGSTPVKVWLRWEVSGCKDVFPRSRVWVRHGDRMVFEGVCVTNAIAVDNLLLGADYGWTVEVRSRGESASACGRFSTERTPPRLVRVDGVPNCRDLGGWTGLDGRRVRQGLVYRSAGWNDNAEKGLPGAWRLTDESRAEVLKTLGIRTDIDLRNAPERRGLDVSPIAPGVGYVFSVPSFSSYFSITGENARVSLRTYLPYFLKPEVKNFPIVFHCIAGADRTGNLAYLLNGLLGVDPEDLLRDYEFTAFGNTAGWYANRQTPFGGGLAKTRAALEGAYPGGTELGRIERFVKDLGFTDADIAAWRAFMLEGE